MSILSYNGVTLWGIHTNSVFAEPEYSEDGVDYLWTHYTISVRAVLNPAVPPTINGETAPAMTYARMKSCLNQPHRPLSFTDDLGNTIVSSPLAGNAIDAKNGPRPKHVNITQIGGSQTYLIEFEVETWLNECCSTTPGQPGQPNPNDYVSHRWQEQHEFDEHFYCKRTVNGILVVRTDTFLPAGGSPDGLRGLVYASVPPGFHRETARYEVTSDKTKLMYTFIDKEVYKVAPAPAVDWEGHIITSTAQSAANFFSEGVIIMKGTKSSRKADMLGRAAIILLNRLQLGQRQANANNRIIAQGHVKEWLHENSIELRIRVINMVSNQTWWGFVQSLKPANPLAWDTIAGVDADPKAPNYPGDAFNSGKQEGDSLTSPVDFLASFIDEPCLQRTIAEQSDNEIRDSDVSDSRVPTSVPPATVVSSGMLLSIQKTDYSQEIQSGGPYTEYKIETTYNTDYHVLQMPLMSSTSSKTTAFAVTAPPTMTKTIKFTAERVGQWPDTPDPEILDDNAVIGMSQIHPSAPVTMADGQTLIYRISGEYKYALVEADECVYQAGVLPFLDVPNTDTDLDEAQFDRGITDTNGGQPLDFQLAIPASAN